MRVSNQQVLEFARWTGDCNPIHVDPVAAKESAFGGTICHGMLVLIEAFSQWDFGFDRFPTPLANIDVQFRSEVRPESLSQINFVRTESGLGGKVTSNAGLQMEIAARFENSIANQVSTPQEQSFSWMSSALDHGLRTSIEERPEPWTTDDFYAGQETLGVHRFALHEPSEKSKFSTVQEQVFGLCSFIVGMRVPGLSSLFTKLKAQFIADPPATEELLYRLTLRNYDDNFRILEMQLEIATRNLHPVANCQIECYVRFPKLDPQLATYESVISDSEKQALSGRIALVCGASRGLGADIAAALASADCVTYLASRRRSPTTDQLVSQIEQRGGKVHVLLGDLGDPKWCQSTRALIEQNHGRLDLLVLNACELPLLQQIADSNPLDSANYIQHNIALYQQPLMHFLGLLKKADGTLVAISSSAVEDPPAGFGDYVSVKLALEGSIRTLAKESSNLRCLIVRPPQLQTAWNDTPIRAVGSVSVPTVATEILVAISPPKWDRNLKLLTKFPKRKAFRNKRNAQIDLALVASFTLDPIHPGFEGWSDLLDIAIQPNVAPYAQILQQALDPTSLASRSTLGSVFLLRSEDWFHELAPEVLSSGDQVSKILSKNASEFVSAMKTHRSLAKGPTLLLICPSFAEPAIAPLFDQAELEIQTALRGLAGLTVWRADAFHARYDIRDLSFRDVLRNTIGHIPYTDAYYDFLSTLCVRHLQRRLDTPKKVVVLDCDNTLWRGVVGELGVEGIGFDPAHHRLQEKLVELAQSGMLLCLCSKNEPEDVWEVFDKRKDFGLRRDQIVASKINWMPKGQNIQELARSLNIGLDSFIFLDDNPVECAEVRATCPSVLTLQWHQENHRAMQLLDHLWELDVHATTNEDRERTKMYREEFQRQEVQANAANFQAFIDSLELKVVFNDVTPENLQRASQLTLRTNQFNFTTIRRNESEILELLKDPTVDISIVQVQDRFGDYGIVGLFIAKALSSGYCVDTFLLSCRVLGRGVEHRMASHIATIAEQRGLSDVIWIYKPSEKNAPARMFLEKIAEQIQVDPKGTEVPIAVASLKNLQFQADHDSQVVDAPSSQDVQPKKESQSTKKRSVRVREEQIRKSVEELATWNTISKSFRRGFQTSNSNPLSHLDVESHVLETFSSVLGIETEKVKSVDRLDALGCDSLQIVGITVSLTKIFTDLPPTLLFEYRSVSEIIEQIKRISTPSSGHASPATSGASVTLGRNQSQTSPIDHQIAIVGIGIQCAAGNDPSSFWNALINQKSMVVPLPTHRDGYVGETEFQHPYFASLMPEVTGFDPEFFGISPREAQYMDPQMRMVLQSSWHALEDAGSFGASYDRSMGIFIGVMYQCYGRLANVIATSNASVYRCWEGFGVANRLSQVLGVSGPSLAIDTACSSSATALHYAVQSLRNGECQSAVVSGVNLILDPARIAQLDNLGILTRSGKCVPFGDQADGTVIGEGAVAIVIKRLSDAMRDSQRVYAIIKGTGLSVGAGSVGFTAPNPVAQSLAIRSALADAQVDPRTIGYVETHGTGTQLGDPIEVRGLEMAYCDQTLWDQDLECQAHTGIGSIKPNIGHLEAGAGLVGVVKAALQLHHKTLLPSITSDRPNPQIPFEKLPFKIQRTTQTWEPLEVFRKSVQTSETLPRRAAVNSFGVGGSNAHIVLQEAPTLAPPSPGMDRSSHLLTLQATSLDGLKLQASRWSKFLKVQNQPSIGNAIYSNIDGRQSFEFRAALLVDDLHAASNNLDRWGAGANDPSESTPELGDLLWGNTLWKKSNRIAYLFTGQGAQYPGMLERLYQENPIFKNAIDQCAKLIDPLLEVPIRHILFGQNSDPNPSIHQTRYTQPAMFVIQYGLFKLWESYGIKPDVVLGHSIGEIAAYCTTGGCSLADALRLVSARGELMQRLDSGGGMTSVSASAQAVETLLAQCGADLSIAAYNGPNQTVVSGSLAQIARFAEQALSVGIKTQALKVSHAFHSKLMEPMLDEFRSVVSKLGLGIPSIELISTVTAKPVAIELAEAEYWVDQVRQPVRFMQAMETLSSKEVSHCVEIGPHPVLVTMAQTMELEHFHETTRWLPSARRGEKDWPVFLKSIGQFYVDGYRVDWKTAEAPYARQRVSVPGYEFSNRRIWLDEINSLVANQNTAEHSKPESIDQNSPERLLYQLGWIRSASSEETLANPVSSIGSDKPWLVLSVGDAALAADLEKQLQSHAYQVRLAHWNPEKRDWNLQPSDLMGVERIVLAAGDASRSLECQNDVQSLCDSQIEAFSQALRLAKAAEASEPSGTDRSRVFWLVTRGAAMLEHAPALAPLSAVLWGGAKVASIELPEYWGGSIDAGDRVHEAVRWIAGKFNEDQVILDGPRVWVPRLEPLRVDSHANAQPVGRSVLISGGLGAIGLRLAEYAMEQGATELILVGRNAKPTDQQHRRIEGLQRNGCSIRYLSADVSSDQGLAQLDSALEGTQIESIFHTAGIDFLSPIAQWTGEDIRRVTQAKIQGAWNLHRWSLKHPIKQFVLTSSIASIWGAPERFLYASANAFLDALGDSRISLKLPVTVLNFGPWADGGMADRSSLEEYQRVGMQGLDPTETLRAINLVLKRGVSKAVITDTRWERFVSVMAARRPRCIFNSVLQDNEEIRIPKKAPSKEPWLTELRGLDRELQWNELKRLVRKELSDVLKSQEERIPSDRNLFRLGLDSITAVELSMRIKKGTGIAAGKWLSGEPTIDSVARALLDHWTVEASANATSDDVEIPRPMANGPWAKELMALSSIEDKKGKMLEWLGRDLERHFGKPMSTLTLETRMPDLGLDSLATVDFATHLRKQLGLSSTPRLMHYPTIGDWILSILNQPNWQRPETSSLKTVSPNVPPLEKDRSSEQAANQGAQILLFEPSLHADVIDFCAKGWQDRVPEIQQKRWDWMFVGSATRMQTAPRVWLARDQNEIVGHMGVQFTGLKIANEEIRSGWFVDTMVLDRYRSQGLGAQILLQAEEQMPQALSLGQTPEVRRILNSLGWKQICPLNIHVFMNNPQRILKGKFPMGLDRFAAAYFSIQRARRTALQSSRDTRIQFRRIDRFDQSHDALWKEMRKSVSCLAVRDSSFLNWKYLDQPGQSYDCWEVILMDRIRGVLVTRTENANLEYPYSRLQWIDLICPMDPPTIHTMIQGCITKSEELKVDAISVHLTHKLVEKGLIENGFLKRPATRYLFASRGLVETQPTLCELDWLVTKGDSDIDRPN
jgi:FkbH-like protein